MTKSKTGKVSKLTEFLLLCVLKSRFFSTAKGPPTNGGDPWEMVSWASADSIHFGKLGCKCAYIEYGGDTGFHQRKGRSPFSNRIQESKIVG